MFGLIVLFVAVLYFGLMFVAVRFAWRTGRFDGGSRSKAFSLAFVAFLIIYLPVFWDHIPTLVVHRYMCAKDAGFTAFVDANVWHEKNAEVVSAVNRLPRKEREASFKLPHKSQGFDHYVGFGGLLRNDYKHESVTSWLTVQRFEQRVADARSGESLAVSIDYRAGKGSLNDLRRWLEIESCVARPLSAGGKPQEPVQPEDFFRQYQRVLWGEQP